ncbi:amidohydrolase family protein [Nocardioides albidus]|uniref:Amidohydrolase family protein n=2 Tax=Nocardioides albidus TaxID=1517589 RepID=A0A5C4W7D1_9ACTN|nr:amidohydrolase family protein [Nocardioides albidus]
MCDESAEIPGSIRSVVTRRGVLAGAAALAGVGSMASAAEGASRSARRAPGRRFPGRPPVPPPVVVEGGPLLDPLTGDVVEDAVVVLAEGRVLAAGSRDATAAAVRQVSGRARTIDAAGGWILPGLIDVHVHVNALADAVGVLRAGATSIRSGTSNFYQDVAMRPLTRWKPGAVPRMRAAGVFVSPDLGDTVLADPDLAPLASLADGVRSPEALAYLTRVNLDRDVDVVKTRANPRAGIPEQDPLELVYDETQLRAVVDAARRGDAPVLCHAYSAEGCHGAVRAGIRSLEHGVFVTEETLDLMTRRGTYFTPTLGPILGLADSPNPILAQRGRDYGPVLKAAVLRAHELGIPVVAGTDTFGTATRSIGSEVRLIGETGVPALDALRGATTTAARLLGWEDRIGRLVPGHLADLVVIDGSPLDDLAAVERVQVVVAQGEVVRDDLAA